MILVIAHAECALQEPFVMSAYNMFALGTDLRLITGGGVCKRGSLHLGNGYN